MWLKNAMLMLNVTDVGKMKRCVVLILFSFCIFEVVAVAVAQETVGTPPSLCHCAEQRRRHRRRALAPAGPRRQPTGSSFATHAAVAFPALTSDTPLRRPSTMSKLPEDFPWSEGAAELLAETDKRSCKACCVTIKKVRRARLGGPVLWCLPLQQLGGALERLLPCAPRHLPSHAAPWSYSPPLPPTLCLNSARMTRPRRRTACRR